VGLPLALVMGDGYTVDILDTNAMALKTIKPGKMPFIEHGGEDLLKRLLPTERILVSQHTDLKRNHLQIPS
jgi:UDP-N-acetyl-D-mannosaminuronic acid dehydrogenase